jgi:V/A-type H+-transporting ATPase subunit C
VFLDRLIKEDSLERILEALKGKSVYPILAAGFAGALEDESFARVENELYKQFYVDLLTEAESGLRGGRQFLDFIILDIDVTNIRNMFRLRADNKEEEDARSMMIPGGNFTTDEFQHLVSIEDQKDFIEALKGKIRLKPLLMLLDEIGVTKSLREIEIELIKVQLAEMESMSKLRPFSIHPILTYLEKKRYEIFNLRALARGKEVNLPTERIRGFLVI